ncbi:MAG TPA: DUF1573 domain-containing protein [Flavobacterium sp.]|jgi:hypothetical protein
MTRKIICAVAMMSAILATSCKKGEIGSAAASTPGSELIKTEETKRATPVDGKYPVMTFAHSEHDFGRIKSGDKVEYVFVFENTGEADLIISDAKGSCGCTVPEFPKEAIKPGEKGEMKVSFNSAGKHGQQKKTVTVFTNTKTGEEHLTISASIEEAAK